ncbi:SPFH domain-containing protein [Butyrivibrio sp. X503]|uniref:SPFH domain-containing protein n=1 Tax=Butyrivibrio sp. X503 TaxID=2364878 RepID=UPI0013141D3E|nr:SPFH domain-containing protein [Butyrivibrio sp. X503]
MALFQSENPKEKQHKGVTGAFSADVIKWEPESDSAASVIVHKFQYEDFPNGSYLIVGTSQMAIFTNNMTAGDSLSANGEGQAQVSVFVGPCKIKLETGNSRFAPFRNVANSLTGGESAFHSTVYFVNTTYMNELTWGTQAPVVLMDPEEEVNIHVRAFGLFGAHIEQVDTDKAVIDARKFLQKVVGTRADFTRDELVSFMRAKILEYVPDLLAKTMIDNRVGILKISTKLSEFSNLICEQLKDHFTEFGLTLDNFSFHSINAPDEDLNAINDMKIKRKQSQIEAEGNAMKMDIESAARARMREREGYTYQQEQSYGVMHDAASNEGTAGGFMGAGMGMGMGLGVGGAIGSNVSALAQNTLGANLGVANTQSPSADEGAICPSCGKSNPKDAKFCLNCGEKLSMGKTCPECGKELLPDAKFCPYCGKKLVTVCPNCGKEVVDGAKFCLECGEKL